MRYGSREVLRDITFQAKRGEVLALLGPNGAGKTTTIEILEGFRRRSAGRVQVLGEDPDNVTAHWRARVGIVLQSWRDHGRWRVRELQLHGINSWLTIAWVLMLGLVATQALGAIIGSLISSPRSVGYVSLPVIALIAISGIFYPISALPEWIQRIAEVFPMYWLGLGMRSALLPDSAAVIELTGSWRQLETAVVLGLWAATGLLIAPVVLGRMARRESGSRVTDRRERAMRTAV